MKQFLLHFKVGLIICASLTILVHTISLGVLLSPNPKSSNNSTELEARIDPEAENTQPPVEEPELTEPTDTFAPRSNLIIRAINPGYKIDDTNDVGELIELQNLTDASLSLAGFSLRYTNGSGNSTTIINFPDGSLMAGEYLLARYSKSPTADLSDLVYTTSLAMTAGPLELLYEGEVVDSVCWTGKAECLKPFKSSAPTTLVRNLDTGLFDHISDYTSQFDPTTPSLILPPEPDDSSNSGNPSDTSPAEPQCKGLEFTELYSYYAKDKTEQFIELFNPTDHEISLKGCQIRYKKKLYPLSGTIKPDQYFSYYPSNQFTLTKNPTSSNNIELLDTDARTVDELIYSHGQKKATSYARFFDQHGEEMWAQTYQITPNQPNIYQEFRSCPTGKVINPATA